MQGVINSRKRSRRGGRTQGIGKKPFSQRDEEFQVPLESSRAPRRGGLGKIKEKTEALEGLTAAPKGKLEKPRCGAERSPGEGIAVPFSI